MDIYDIFGMIICSTKHKTMKKTMQYIVNKRGNIFTADLIKQNLKNVDLHNCDLLGSFFTGADLRNANLRGANLDLVVFDDADLRGAQIDEHTDVRRASFWNAKMDEELREFLLAKKI